MNELFLGFLLKHCLSFLDSNICGFNYKPLIFNNQKPPENIPSFHLILCILSVKVHSGGKGVYCGVVSGCFRITRLYLHHQLRLRNLC